MDDKSAAQIGQTAAKHFASGLYCAESVVVALAESQGIDSPILPRIATGFCSGIARTCGDCGALNGGIMGIGLALGRNTERQSIDACYKATQDLIAEFEREFGSRNCQGLVDCDLGTSEGRTAFADSNLIETCAGYVAGAAEMAARAIDEHS